MSPTATAAILVLVGYVLVVVGCALISPALAFVVGGAGLVALGLAIDEPKRRGPR